MVGAELSVTGLDREWGRRGGFRDRVGITIGARQAILPQPGGWRIFGGHDATTRAEPEAVGRRALPKPWLIFKLASGLWPASRCSASANQTPRPSLSLKRSLAPINCSRHHPQAKESRIGVRPQSCALLVNGHRRKVHLHPRIVTMNLSHNLFPQDAASPGDAITPPFSSWP